MNINKRLQKELRKTFFSGTNNHMKLLPLPQIKMCFSLQRYSTKKKKKQVKSRELDNVFSLNSNSNNSSCNKQSCIHHKPISSQHYDIDSVDCEFLTLALQTHIN